MRASESTRSRTGILVAAAVILAAAAILVGRQFFAGSGREAASEPDATSLTQERAAPVSVRQERRQAKRERLERRARAQLQEEAVPTSERLAQMRARDGEPAAERPDLDMLRANGGKPLTDEQRQSAARRMIEAGRRAMQNGDLGLAYEHLFRAAETYSSVETHAVLGELLLQTRMTQFADYHLRWAAEHDPQNPDRWIALANAYALKPDPGAAYKAVAKAREADPSIDVVRSEHGWFERRGS